MTTLVEARRPATPLTTSVILASLFVLLPLAGFALLVEGVAESERQAWDESFVTSMTGFRAWWADASMTAASLIGGGKGMLVLTSAFLGFLAVGRRYGEAALVTVAVIGAAILGRAFKNTIDRPRPEEARSVWSMGGRAAVIIVLAIVAMTWWTRWRRAGLATGSCFVALLLGNGAIDLWKPTPGMDSFPSGHAVSSMAVVAAGTVLAWPTRFRGVVVAGGGLLLAVSGFSRIYFGLHYPSDVLGGWALGIAWVALVVGVRTAYRGRRGSPDARTAEPVPAISR